MSTVPFTLRLDEEIKLQLEEEADKGAFVSSGAMRNWLASWGSDAKLPPPAADVFLREKKTWRSQVVINTKDSFFVALPSD